MDMLSWLLTTIVSYISTNIDDLFILTVLLAQVRPGRRGALAGGHFLGIGLLTMLSILGAYGLSNLPLKYLGLLGLIPILLGIRAWLERNKEDTDDTQARNLGFWSMTLITLGNGGDNLGVYIPLFTGYSPAQRFGALGVFAGMCAAWLFLAGGLSSLPRLKDILAKHKGWLIPLVFIALGLYILLDYI